MVCKALFTEDKLLMIGEDFVRSIGLMSSNDPEAELLATSASVATFKVWPTTLDLGKAVFAFTDTYKTRALVPALKYVEGSAKWVDNRQRYLECKYDFRKH